MSLDDKINSIEDAIAKTEDIGDILQEAVSEFGQSLTDCLDSISSDMEKMFSEVFEGAGDTLKSEFADAAKGIKDVLDKSLKIDLSSIKKQIEDLRKSLGGGGRGGRPPGQPPGQPPGPRESGLRQGLSDLNREKKRGGYIGPIIDDLKMLAGKEFDELADANKIASQFRQVGDRAGQDTINRIKGQFTALRQTMAADAQELKAVYANAIEGGFTEAEMASGGEMDLGEQFLRADRFLGIGAGASAKIAGQMKTVSDTVDATNITDKILEMKIAAEKTGVSFNKFSSAAMEIATSLRPLGLDISHTTNLLANMSNEYEKSGMSEERAFETARKGIQGVVSGLQNMDVGKLAAFAKSSDKLTELLGTDKALDAGAQLELLLKGGGKFQGKENEEKRTAILQELVASITAEARRAGVDADDFGEMQQYLKEIVGLDALGAEAFQRFNQAMNDPTATAEDKAEARKGLETVFATDSENISALKKFVSNIQAILVSFTKGVFSILAGIAVGIDSIADTFSDGFLDDKTSAALTRFALDAGDGIIQSFDNLSETTKEIQEQSGKIAKIKGDESIMKDAGSKGDDDSEKLLGEIANNTREKSSPTKPSPGASEVK